MSAIPDARKANDFALIRRAAQTWADTRVGRHYRILLREIDGGAPVTDKQLQEILTRGYDRTAAGDGVGDDIHALIEAIGERRRAKKP